MAIPISAGASGRVDTSREFFNKDGVTVLTLGGSSYINGLVLEGNYVKNPPHTLIGRYCSLAWKITVLMDLNHNYKYVSTFPIPFANERPEKKVKTPRQIIIGNDVWIGYGVTIMGGVKIGTGAVIGANAVVAKDIPPYAIAVGNPARVVKYRFDAGTIKKLLAVKWWNWDFEKFKENIQLVKDVEKFLETHYSPELEEFPEDEFTQKLNNLGGVTVYHFIPDFEAKNPLWLKVIQDFQKANVENAVLVIWLPKDSTEENSRSLSETIGDSKNIVTFKHDKNFSPAALRKATHFITTREMSTLEALDYLWDTDVKIISALDNGIFST